MTAYRASQAPCLTGHVMVAVQGCMPNVAGWFNGTEHVIRSIQPFKQQGQVLRISYGVHVR